MIFMYFDNLKHEAKPLFYVIIRIQAQEARTSFLRDRAGERVKESGEDLPIPLAEIADLTQSDGHINFFQEIEDGKRQETGVNAEHESEKKKEQEDYEKKIGLLVYLGQDSVEGSKNRPWYENINRRPTPTSASASVTDKDKDKAAIESRELKITKLKDFEDPLKDIRKYLHTPGVKKKYNSSSSVTTSASLIKRKAEDQPQPLRKHNKKSKKEKKKKSKRSKSKKSKRHESDSGSSGPDSEEERKVKNLEKLRAERLTREREERRKADKLLANLRGETLPEPSASAAASTDPMSRISAREPVVKQKYNSQFNPHLARQNYDN